MNYKIILEIEVTIMTNKEKLNKAIEQDINLKNCYNEVIKKIEEGMNMKNKNNMCKWSLVPICLVTIISGVLFLKYQNDNKTKLENKSFVDEKNNVTLNINEIPNDKSLDLAIDIKTVAANDTNFLQPYKNEIINLPKDLNKTYRFIIYTRENMDSEDYNILNNYIIEYSNDNNKSIKVAYSKEHRPLRDYYFSDEGSKVTTINDVELKIYKFEDIYFTEFKFNDYNFDIETSKITEQELSNFLLSILK